MSLQGAQALPCIPGRSIHTAPVPRRAVSCELSPHAPSPGPARRAGASLPSQCHEVPQTPGHVWQLGTGSRCPQPGIGRSLGPGGRSRGLSRLHPSGPGAVTAAGWLLFRSRHQRDDKRHRASLQRHLRGVQHPREPAALEGEPAHPWLFPAPQCCQGLGRAAGAAGPRTALERPPCPGRAPPRLPGSASTHPARAERACERVGGSAPPGPAPGSSPEPSSTFHTSKHTNSCKTLGHHLFVFSSFHTATNRPFCPFSVHRASPLPAGPHGKDPHCGCDSQIQP